MRLHDYAASGNCFKVRLLLRLADLDCELVPVDIFAGDTLSDAFGRLNPVRETPVLELDDGRVITQSSAILAFLARGTAFEPADPVDHAHAVAWLGFEQERVMPQLGGTRFRRLTGRATAAQLAERVAGAPETLGLLDAHLAGREWLAGDAPSFADLGLFPYTSRAEEAGVALAPFPPVTAWLDRVRALPGFHDDLVTYPPNARPGAGRSTYD